MRSSAHVLVVARQSDWEKHYELALTGSTSFSVAFQSEVGLALPALSSGRCDVLILDLDCEAENGLEVVSAAMNHHPQLSVIVASSSPSLRIAQECLRRGVRDYLVKPLKARDLRHALHRILSRCCMSEEGTKHQGLEDSPSHILFQSAVMAGVLDLLRRVAHSDCRVLIRGETGTGKELAARFIHSNSGRRDGPFIAINCAAITAHLLESELFGYEKGAFTGALSSKQGFFELASGGVLFLDEIADLPLELQSKLLRALQSNRFFRVGGQQEVAVDVRVLAATSTNLHEAVMEKLFRLDLYHRINVVSVDLPPLRERPGDVELLAEHFVAAYCREYGRSKLRLTPSAIAALEAYDWPGNIRELENLVERAVVTHPGGGDRIEPKHLDVSILSTHGNPAASDDLGGFMEARRLNDRRFASTYLRSLLQEHAGDVTAAAKSEGMKRSTLYRYLEKYGVSPANFRTGRRARAASGN